MTEGHQKGFSSEKSNLFSVPADIKADKKEKNRLNAFFS